MEFIKAVKTDINDIVDIIRQAQASFKEVRIIQQYSSQISLFFDNYPFIKANPCVLIIRAS